MSVHIRYMKYQYVQPKQIVSCTDYKIGYDVTCQKNSISDTMNQGLTQMVAN